MDYKAPMTMIREAKRILLTTHVRPDGDALGSLVGLQQIIEQVADREGREAPKLLLLSEPAANYCFLLEEKPWILGRDLTQAEVEAGKLDAFDLIVVVDTSAARQLPGLSDYLTARESGILVFDHHLSNDDIGSLRLIDVNAGAAAEILYHFCQAQNIPINEKAARALFVAIATDTGWFRFENTSSHLYRIAGELVEAGARPAELYHELYQSFPPARLRLMQLALETLELYEDDRLAVMHISKDMLRQSGAERGNIENIVNEPMQIREVVGIILLVEQDDGTTRVSLRSREIIDVNAVAREFGGGGHARAAGLRVPEPLLEAKDKLIEAMRSALKD